MCAKSHTSGDCNGDTCTVSCSSENGASRRSVRLRACFNVWNCRLVRGEGRVARPGVVEVDGEEHPYDKLVVATGSRPAIPPVDGLGEVEYWTNREATRAHQVPESLVVLGGGPVGCELAQFYARMGAKVTIVERGGALLGPIQSGPGRALDDAFR